MSNGMPVGDRGAALGEVSVIRTPERTRMVLAGEIDVGLNGTLVGAIDEALDRGLPVDVDTRAVTFMDSAAIALIARLAYQASTRPRIIGPPEGVRFLLDLTNVQEVVDVVEHDPEAGDAA